MKKRAAAAALVLSVSLAVLSAAPQMKEEDLPKQYQEWLVLTRYIMLPEEKEVFLRLDNNPDRNAFMEIFWKQRDPTSGTPQNEFRDEHQERVNYANKYYRRGTTRPGWMTDMGRIHIILGPPISTEKFEGVPGIYPCQVWSYYGDASLGLPTHFNLLFFQRSGAGEFRLYNALSDGPTSLLVDTRDLDLTNHQQVYRELRQLAPTLAGPAISMIPGQITFGYRPSLNDNFILSNIVESPKKRISPRYATHFLEYKGMVSTEYLTNYIESEFRVAVLQDPYLNINFVHFSLSPDSISIDYYEPRDQYFCNFEVNVSLRDKERIIYQYSKDYPFYFSPENAERIQGSGVAVQDSFPLIEGTYTLNVLMQNSVGKEFCIFEQEITVPEIIDKPVILGPIIGYKLQDDTSPLLMPFKILDKKLLIDSKGNISPAEEVALLFNVVNVPRPLWENGRLEVLIQGLGPKSTVRESFELDLKNYPYNPNIGISHTLPARDLPPDYYTLTLTLWGAESSPAVESSAEFIVTPQEMIPHPTTLAKSFPLSNNYIFFYSLAYQYNSMGHPEKAQACYERAYTANPAYKPGKIEYARFLQKAGRFRESLEIIESLKDDEEYRFQFYLLRGEARMGMGIYGQAIDDLLEGNKIYNSYPRLLNSLGFCYYKSGDKTKALDALKASLRLNPDQEPIRRLIAEIEND